MATSNSKFNWSLRYRFPHGNYTFEVSWGVYDDDLNKLVERANAVQSVVIALLESAPKPAEAKAEKIAVPASNGHQPPICNACGQEGSLIRWTRDGQSKQAWKCEDCNRWLK